ncbi:MAG: methyltransferase domain-containing protein [Bacteroidetes bacterium]|nr:methyltransferase domain-containing protein [Bacteroidota bacterium]
MHKVKLEMNKKWRWNAAQFAERKWWQNYLKNKDIPGYLSWKKEYWQNLLKKCTHYFSIHSEDSILDAGCGPAGMFMLFENNKTVAFDPLIDVYETDLPHFKKNMYPYVHFVNSGLEDFTSTEKFDILFCMNAINHVHDIEKSFDHLIAYANPDAHIIVTIDAHNHSTFKHLFRLLPGDILHPHQYDLNEYQQMLIQRGCEILGTELLKHEFFFDHYLLVAKKIRR